MAPLMDNKPLSPENAALASAALARLDRLESYLGADPGNPALLADAFETALQCAQWERAAFHLRHGLALQADVLSWRLKEGDLLLAQGRYAEARAALKALQGVDPTPAGFKSVVLHNLAYIEFRQGNYAECIAELAGHMEDFAGLEQALSGGDGAAIALPDQLLQRLWLRSLHRTGELQRACDWARTVEKLRLLDAHAAGIASLAAIDMTDMISAGRWAATALQQAEGGNPSNPFPAEVFVTQLTLALGARKADDAIAWADCALELNGEDGRAWSGRAFALLLKGDLKLARRDFARALQAMPGHIGTWHGQGWAQLLDHDLEAARKSFGIALELDRNFAESHGGMAVVLALARRESSARQHADRALGLDKNNLSGRYAQALLNGEVKDSTAIRRLAQRLLSSREMPDGVSVPDFMDGTPRA